MYTTIRHCCKGLIMKHILVTQGVIHVMPFYKGTIFCEFVKENIIIGLTFAGYIYIYIYIYFMSEC